jgi:hypothetical protein
MAFLKTILIILLVYYLFKILARWFAPKILSFAAKKAEKYFQEKFGTYQGEGPGDEEILGNRNAHSSSSNKKNTSEKVGEYIDFEEIE